jgi:hypothetical protein
VNWRLTAIIKDVLDKLLLAEVVEKRNKELVFTTSFGLFLICALRKKVLPAETVGDWRNILADYHKSLKQLSSIEISVMVLLLDFYFRNFRLAEIDKGTSEGCSRP